MVNRQSQHNFKNHKIIKRKYIYIYFAAYKIVKPKRNRKSRKTKKRIEKLETEIKTEQLRRIKEIETGKLALARAIELEKLEKLEIRL